MRYCKNHATEGSGYYCFYIQEKIFTLLVFILWSENFIGVWFNLLQIQMYEASHLPFIHDIVNPYSWYLNDVKKNDSFIQFRILNFLFHLFMYITKADICFQTLYWTSNACTCLSYIYSSSKFWWLKSRLKDVCMCVCVS